MTTIAIVSIERKRATGVRKIVDEDGLCDGYEEKFDITQQSGYAEINHAGTPIGSIVATEVEAKANKEKRVLKQKEKARDYIRGNYRYVSPALVV